MTNTNPPAAAPDLDALMRRAMEMGPCSRVEVFREDIFYLIRAARDRAALLRAAEKLRSALREREAMPTACRKVSFDIESDQHFIASSGHYFDHCVDMLDAAIAKTKEPTP